MTTRERVLAWILRIVGGLSVTAVVPAVFPFSWLDAIHKWLGLGTLPAEPIVSYLARSLSLFYACYGAVLLYVSRDVREHAKTIAFLAVLMLVFSLFMIGVDVSAGMPVSWTLSEGPPLVVLSLVVLWLARQAQRAS